ncbi:protein kinase domain-containing protein [Gimesia algae]|uniref:Serine/threonine-protein kinase StkP n=1 Tax=Gimesia algae TaxID=2527971 RepID=A0A517VAF7_9PLAN|nr:SUMF1/EgtB/PvdO family nonheme iron enzyme [Gimesia algae]QDT89991.1 Serine/threonine-protein kinase StkP [Gimesia algae]
MVESNSSICPNLMEISDYSLGKLDFTQIETLSSHFNICEVCRDKLERLDDEPDELINRLRVPPLSIGQISLEYEIGSGGMGRVFKGYDARLIRPVAVKLINTERQKEWKDLAERFEREVQILARVESPFVVKALFAGEENGFTYFVQEYVDGKNLKERMDELRFSMPARASASIVYQVASGLTAVHKLGIVHRDIHPGNLLLNTRGFVQIADFGLAFEEGRSDGSELTSMRQGFGQVNYVAPEQWNSARNATSSSDIYSLGCIWFFLITGLPLNRNPKTLEIIHPSSQFQMISRADRKLLISMLHQNPQLRPTAENVVAALKSRVGTVNSVEDILKKQSDHAPAKWKRTALFSSATLIALCFLLYLVLLPGENNISQDVRPTASTVGPPLPESNPVPQDPFALRFDGVDDFVETPFVYDDGDPVTFEVWLTPDCVKEPRSMEIVSNAETAGIALKLYEGTRPQFLFHQGTTYAAHNRAKPISCGSLIHLAGVYDGISICVYVNGKKQGLSFPVRQRHRQSPIPIHLGANPDPALIGRTIAEKSRCFAGLLHQCRFSKGAIYQADFAPEKLLSSTDSTILLYHFNTDTGEIAKDKSGNEHDGKIVGATWEKYDPLDIPEKKEQYQWHAERPDPVLVNDSPARIQELQRAWAEHLKLPAQIAVPVGENVNIDLVLIPPGEFMLGTLEETLQKPDPPSIPDGPNPRKLTADLPQQLARITSPYYLSKTEISRKQFRNFVSQTRYTTDAEIDRSGGSDFKSTQNNSQITWASDLDGALSEDHPVANLSWYDANNYCGWLTRNQSRFVFSLPAEAQWEYACRAGTTSNWYTSAESELSKYAWFQSTTTHPCGQLQPNAFGLLDMHGNVSEWCQDYFSDKDSFSNSVNNPSEPNTGVHRIIRGGSAGGEAEHCRSAAREGLKPILRDALTGFRVCAKIRSLTADVEKRDQFSLHFNGTDDYAEATYEYRNPAAPLTIECWVNIPEATIKDQFASSVIFDLHSHMRAFFCVLRNHRIHMYFHEGEWVWHSFSAEISSGKHHIAGVFDGTTLNTFVDGSIPEKVTKNPAQRVARFLRSTFRIGSGSTYENSQHRGFQGNVSQFRISEQEVYHNEFQPPPLLTKRYSTVVLYRFEEGKGKVLHDLSGMFNHARISGAEWSVNLQPDKQLTSRGVQFDGDDWIEAKFPDQSTDNFTIEAWVSPETKKKLAHQLIFQLGNLSLKYHVNNGEYWTWSLLDPHSQEIPVSAVSSKDIALNHPVHIACHWNGPSWRMFVNGLPCRTLRMRGVQKERLAEIISTSLNNKLLIGGTSPTENVQSHCFEGKIHAFRISGVERYRNSFTPQNRFAVDQETLLLYRFDGNTDETVQDSSGNSFHGILHGANGLLQ